MALFQRARQYILEVDNELVSASLKKDLEELVKEIGGQEFAAHAHSVLEGEVPEEDGVPGVKPAIRSKKVCSCLYIA